MEGKMRKLEEYETYLGRNIGDYLRESKTTLSELSRDTCIPLSTLSDWINHKQTVWLNVSQSKNCHLKVLAKKMDTTIDKLCFSFLYPLPRSLRDMDRVSKYVNTTTHNELPDSSQLALGL